MEHEPAIILFDADRRTTWSLMFNYARKEIGDQIHFVMADYTDLEKHDLVSSAMRLKDYDLPIMLIIDAANMVKYKMPHELNTVFKEDIIIADSIVQKEVANKAVNAQYVNLSSLLIKDSYEDEE